MKKRVTLTFDVTTTAGVLDGFAFSDAVAEAREAAHEALRKAAGPTAIESYPADVQIIFGRGKL